MKATFLRRAVISITLLTMVVISLVVARACRVIEKKTDRNGTAERLTSTEEFPTEAQLRRVEEVDDVIARVNKAHGFVVFAEQLPSGTFDPDYPSIDHMDLWEMRDKYQPDLQQKLTRRAIYASFDTFDQHYPSDADIAALSTLDTLEFLSVNNNLGYYSTMKREDYYDDGLITDASVDSIAKLSNLRFLGLSRTKITVNGLLRLLPTLRKLEFLELQHTHTNDDVLNAMAESPNPHLHYLNLRGTNITDASVAAIGKLKGLREVYLTDTKVTATGANRIRRELPQCSIDQ